MDSPESLQTTWSPSAARAERPARHSALLVGVRAGPSGVLHDDGQIGEGRQPGCRRRELIRMRHQFEDQLPVPQFAEDGAVGDRVAQGSHGTDAAEAGGRHLAVEERDRLRHRLGRWESPDDGGGTALVRRVAIELEGLVDGVGSRGGGDVDELLDVPSCRLGPVGVRVEPPVHPRTAALVPGTRQVRVPVGPCRIPQVDVRVDDAGGRVGHRASGRELGPGASTIWRSAPSIHPGIAGPP